MTLISAFVDVAGRISRATDGYSHVTAAGVAISTETVPHVRNRLESAPKWSKASAESLGEIVRQLSTLLISVVVISAIDEVAKGTLRRRPLRGEDRGGVWIGHQVNEL